MYPCDYQGKEGYIKAYGMYKLLTENLKRQGFENNTVPDIEHEDLKISFGCAMICSRI